MSHEALSLVFGPCPVHAQKNGSVHALQDQAAEPLAAATYSQESVQRAVHRAIALFCAPSFFASSQCERPSCSSSATGASAEVNVCRRVRRRIAMEVERRGWVRRAEGWSEVAQSEFTHDKDTIHSQHTS